MRNDPREGTPLSQQELVVLLRLVVLGAKNIRKSDHPPAAKNILYERQWGIVEMAEKAPDLVRLEINKALSAQVLDDDKG